MLNNKAGNPADFDTILEHCAIKKPSVFGVFSHFSVNTQQVEVAGGYSAVLVQQYGLCPLCVVSQLLFARTLSLQNPAHGNV